MIGIVFFIFGWYLAGLIVKSFHKQGKVSGPCKQHTWDYDSTGFLKCTTCNKVPGEI